MPAAALLQANSNVRRRYGSLTQHDGQKYRYHQYHLLSGMDPDTGDWIEDRGAALFHLMLPVP